MEMITRREDFVRANHHARVIRVAGFTLQVLANEQSAIRFGLTATRRLGKAVLRNRAKRRMRGLIRRQLQGPNPLFQQGMDYIFICKRATLYRPFSKLQKDLIYALHQADRTKDADTGRNPRKKPL